MANLTIEAVPSEQLRRYEFQLDDDENDLDMGDQNQCSVEVAGTCGDGSKHYLYYALVGPVGATLGLKILCDGTVKKDIPLEVFAPGPKQSGDVEFRL